MTPESSHQSMARSTSADAEPRRAVAGNIRFEHLTKTFGTRTVLNDVTFDVTPGTVTALLGQNGSGKSTLIKLLSGFHRPDRTAHCRTVVDGASHEFSDALTTKLVRVAPVHQDLGLDVSASVTENLLLNSLGNRALSPIGWRSTHARARRILRTWGAGNIDPRLPVGALSPLQRASVAVARAVEGVQGGGLLILDEVTAFLSVDATRELFKLVRTLTDRGIAVLFVSHRLEEVYEVCDRAIVLRNGELVAERPIAGTTEDDLTEAIVGHSLGWLYPDKNRYGSARRLRVTGLNGRGLHDVSFDAHEGEIVGLTGLRGMGHDRVVYALYGELSRTTGVVEIDETKRDISFLRPRRAAELGVRLVPSDRLKNGAAGSATIRENLSLPLVDRFFRFGALSKRAESGWALDVALRYGLSPPEPEHIYSSLSGGNQQKALMARWLETEPRLLLLDEPTQGVDIGSRRDIFKRISDAAASGMTVVYSTTEIQDLAEICHRVLVFRDGGVVGQLSGPDATEAAIGRLCWKTSNTSATTPTDLSGQL